MVGVVARPAQSSFPASPDALKTVWPWAAASSKIRCSAANAPGAKFARALSQRPHEVDTVEAASSATIWL